MTLTSKKALSSALQEKAGISQPESISSQSVEHIQHSRKIQPSAEALVQGILAGNITALSRAITLIESSLVEHNHFATEIVEKCLPYAGKSIRIGITGVPGVGKSTFIESFGTFLTTEERKIEPKPTRPVVSPSIPSKEVPKKSKAWVWVVLVMQSQSYHCLLTKFL